MMKKKTVKLVLGIILLGILTGSYFGVKFRVAKWEGQEEKQEEEKTSVFHTETDKIQSLKFMVDEKEIIFRKDGENWIKEGEEDFPVNQDVLDGAASSISSVDAQRVLEQADELMEYELDNPQNTITIHLNTGESTVIRVGMKNSSTGQYYINKDEDRNTVYVVDAASITPFMDSLYDYAQMQTFPAVDSTTISKIVVNQSEKGYEAVKDEDTGLWTIESEGKIEKGDSSKLGSMVNSIGSLEYDSFVDYNCTDKGKYGLEKPYAIVKISWEETIVADNEEETKAEEAKMEEKELVFMIGSEASSDSRYIMVDDNKEVYTMTNDLLSTVIDKNVSTMWDMTVNYVSLNDLESLSVKLYGEEKEINVSRETLEENESSEKDTEENNTGNSTDNDTVYDSAEIEEVTRYLCDGKTLDSTDFSIFYNKLVNITGNRRVTEEYNPENKPEMSVVFHKTTNGESVNVDFYKYDVNYYAAVVDKKTYLFNKMTFKELKEAYENMFLEEDAE